MVSGGTAAPLSVDFPYCGPVAGATPPAPRFEKYHLADGASDRDKLFLAVVRDDKDSLSAYLAAGADANSARGRGLSVADDGLVTFADDTRGEKVSLIHWAASSSYTGETIRLLIAHGANVRDKDSKGLTPLMEAAQNLYLAADGIERCWTRVPTFMTRILIRKTLWRPARRSVITPRPRRSTMPDEPEAPRSSARGRQYQRERDLTFARSVVSACPTTNLEQ